MRSRIDEAYVGYGGGGNSHVVIVSSLHLLFLNLLRRLPSEGNMLFQRGPKICRLNDCNGTMHICSHMSEREFLSFSELL